MPITNRIEADVETAATFQQFKRADAALVKLVQRVHNNVQKERSSRELYGAARDLKKILELIAKTLTAAFPGTKFRSSVSTGSHDIDGHVSFDEDDVRPESTPDTGIFVNIDGNFKGHVGISVFMNRKSKDFNTDASGMREGMLLDALTELNRMLAKRK